MGRAAASLATQAVRRDTVGCPNFPQCLKSCSSHFQLSTQQRAQRPPTGSSSCNSLLALLRWSATTTLRTENTHTHTDIYTHHFPLLFSWVGWRAAWLQNVNAKSLMSQMSRFIMEAAAPSLVELQVGSRHLLPRLATRWKTHGSTHSAASRTTPTIDALAPRERRVKTRSS